MVLLESHLGAPRRSTGGQTGNLASTEFSSGEAMQRQDHGNAIDDPVPLQRTRDAVLGSFNKGVAWLARHRANTGGWGDESTNPRPGVTGHVLICLSDLGITDSPAFSIDFEWLGRQVRRPDPKFGMYWTDNLLFSHEEPEHTIPTSMLAALPILTFKNGLSAAGIGQQALHDSILGWVSEVVDSPEPYFRKHGTWILLMASRLLNQLSYRGPLWHKLRQAISDLSESSAITWAPREGLENVATAHALLALLGLPSPDTELTRAIALNLATRAIENPSFACWPGSAKDPMRGPVFVTRWVLWALSNFARSAQTPASLRARLGKGAAWLAQVQRPDGAWAEIKGDPFALNELCHNTETGPGIVANALASLASWLLMTGMSRDELTASAQRHLLPPPKVFICHAKDDTAKAQEIASCLKTAGVDPWIDTDKLVHGDLWEQEIRKAVKEADAFVVCLRPGFDQVGFRQKEVRWAVDALGLRPPGRSFIIPFIIEPCELPDWCKPFHAGADLSKPTTLDDLLAAIRKHCRTH